MRKALFLLSVLLLSVPARAEVILRGVAWQLTSAEKGQPRGPQPIERWVQGPAPRVGLKPRVLVTLANRGPKAVDGVVLSYALSARLAKAGENGKEGVWTVPFFINERRVPRVRANQTIEVPLNDLVLAVFLKKVHRAGYWPDALKIQIMVEPKPGEGLDQRILEHVLPVVSK